MIRRTATEIDVLDYEHFDLAFNIKADQPKCIQVWNSLIFVGTWTSKV